MAANDPEFEEFIRLSGRNATYTSPSTQNYLIKIMAENIRLQVKSRIQEATCWGFSFDETPDCSGKEQLCFLVRYVTANNEYREDFLGFWDPYKLTNAESLNAKNVAKAIDMIIADLELDKSKMVSVCTDGANVLSGKDAGAIKLLKEKFPCFQISEEKQSIYGCSKRIDCRKPEAPRSKPDTSNSKA